MLVAEPELQPRRARGCAADCARYDAGRFLGCALESDAGCDILVDVDLPLAGLTALIALALVLKVRTDVRLRSSPRHRRQRVISLGMSGVFVLVAGVAGRDLRFSRGWLRGMPREESTLWWEVVLGAALIGVAFAWARRLRDLPARSTEWRQRE